METTKIVKSIQLKILRLAGCPVYELEAAVNCEFEGVRVHSQIW